VISHATITQKKEASDIRLKNRVVAKSILEKKDLKRDNSEHGSKLTLSQESDAITDIIKKQKSDKKKNEGSKMDSRKDSILTTK